VSSKAGQAPIVRGAGSGLTLPSSVAERNSAPNPRRETRPLAHAWTTLLPLLQIARDCSSFRHRWRFIDRSMGFNDRLAEQYSRRESFRLRPANRAPRRSRRHQLKDAESRRRLSKGHWRSKRSRSSVGHSEARILNTAIQVPEITTSSLRSAVVYDEAWPSSNAIPPEFFIHWMMSNIP